MGLIPFFTLLVQTTYRKRGLNKETDAQKTKMGNIFTLHIHVKYRHLGLNNMTDGVEE